VIALLMTLLATLSGAGAHQPSANHHSVVHTERATLSPRPNPSPASGHPLAG
jgi:hypothetical protein